MSESNTRAEIVEVMRDGIAEHFGEVISPFGLTEIASAALTALESSGRAVVPREPTQAMIDAGLGLVTRGDIWSAMLAAALPPSKE